MTPTLVRMMEFVKMSLICTNAHVHLSGQGFYARSPQTNASLTPVYLETVPTCLGSTSVTVNQDMEATNVRLKSTCVITVTAVMGQHVFKAGRATHVFVHRI